MNTNSEFLTINEAARFLRVVPLTLRNWRKRNQGPPFIRLGPRIIRYPVPSLTAYLVELEIRPSDSVEG